MALYTLIRQKLLGIELSQIVQGIYNVNCQ